MKMIPVTVLLVLVLPVVAVCDDTNLVAQARQALGTAFLPIGSTVTWTNAARRQQMGAPGRLLQYVKERPEDNETREATIKLARGWANVSEQNKRLRGRSHPRDTLNAWRVDAQTSWAWRVLREAGDLPGELGMDVATEILGEVEPDEFGRITWVLKTGLRKTTCITGQVVATNRVAIVRIRD